MWFEAEDDFVHVVAQIEPAPLVAGLVDRHLLEAGDQLGGATQVAQQDVACLVHVRHERLQGA